MALVDVIIPTRNRFELTQEAIRSVQAQTFRDWQLWVMDDASDDGSLERLRSTFESDSRVKFYAGKKLGPVLQRQVALDLGESPWVALLDSDDLWLPDKLSRQLALGTEGDLILAWYQWFRQDGSIRKTERLDASGPVSPLFTNNMSVPLISRPLLKSIGGFWARSGTEPPLTCDNVELYIRLLRGATVAVVPEVLTRCRDHAGPRSSDASRLARGASELTAIVEAHWDDLAQWPVERRELLARAGARHLSAGNLSQGYRMLGRAVFEARWPERSRLASRYGPLLIKTAPFAAAASIVSFTRRRHSARDETSRLMRGGDA